MLESTRWPGWLPAVTEVPDDVFDSPALSLGQEPAHEGGLLIEDRKVLIGP